MRPTEWLIGCVVLVSLTQSLWGEPPARKARSRDKGTLQSADQSVPEGKSSSNDRGQFAQLALALTNLVLDHHIDPPTSQEMVLAVAKSWLHLTGRPVPAGLSRRVSSLTTRDEFAGLLNEVVRKVAASKNNSPDKLQAAMLAGFARTVPGRLHLIPAKELKVQRQFAGNRYVGIGIALAYDSDLKLPKISVAFPGGPARKAGAKVNDLIVEVNGVKTHKLGLRKIVDLLRGDEGTALSVVVRQAPSGEPRTLKMIRGVIPFQTVVGIREVSEQQWNFRVDSKLPIGYVKIRNIRGSTLHELRKIAGRLKSDGVRALILDLRSGGGHAVHHAVMLADGLLDGGKIGQVRTSTRVQEYRATPDCLFKEWPLAVLVDGSTSAEFEWLAAALQDNRRAVIVGAVTRGDGSVVTSVALPEGKEFVMLTTGLMQRADGRPITRLAYADLRPRRSVTVVTVPAQKRPDRPQWGVRPEHNVTRRTSPVDVAVRVLKEALKKPE